MLEVGPSAKLQAKADPSPRTSDLGLRSFECSGWGGEGLSDHEQLDEEILPEPFADDVALRGKDSTKKLATVEADPAQGSQSRE